MAVEWEQERSWRGGRGYGQHGVEGAISDKQDACLY